MSKPIVLKLFKNGGVVDIKQFLNENQIVIGSSEGDAQVKLQGQISPFHASIEKRGDKYVLTDLGSSQGTYLKGNKILEAGLEHGDKIAIGEYIIEFYIGAPGPAAAVSATASVTTPAPTPAPAAPAPATSTPAASGGASADGFRFTPPQVTSKTVGGAEGGFQAMTINAVAAMPSRKKKNKGEKTFAPPSHHKNLSEFIKPTKGSRIEVLVAWRERVINAYHFHDKGTYSYGTHPSCDILVPALAAKVNKAPLLQLDGQVSVFIPPGMAGSLVVENNSTPLSQLYTQGRLQAAAGGGSKLNLAQGEMVRVQVGPDVELVVRYCSETPKPVFIPMIDFASNGFLAVLLAIILAIVVSLYVALNKVENKEMDDEEYRTALIIENPPPPPPPQPIPKIEEVKPPEKEIPPPPPKVVKQEQPKEQQKKVEVKKAEAKKEPVKQAQTKAGGGNQQAPGSIRPNKNLNKPGAIKHGGSVKTSPKEGAQADSTTKDPNKSGIFSVFGGGGKQKEIDKDYAGGGELAGLANKATGQSGYAEDRPGEGIGSKIKDIGGGKGTGNVGVAGIGTGKGLGMGTNGFGGTSLGGKGTVTIIPGGGDESYGGNIDRNGIRQVFISNQRALQSCYEAALAGDKGLSGKLVLDFDIGEQGRVLRADMSREKSTLTSSQLATCVINRMKNWRFPEPPQNQTVQVFYPLAFSGK